MCIYNFDAELNFESFTNGVYIFIHKNLIINIPIEKHAPSPKPSKQTNKNFCVLWAYLKLNAW